jgi:hypothetical protein
MATMSALCSCKSYLSGAAKTGKQALTKEHRQRVQTKATTKILASIDFDETARQHFPEHARWDYLLEVKQLNTSARTIAVEFHSVEFSRIERKRRDSMTILTSECEPTPKVSEWILVPEGDTGGYALTVRRKLADVGIRVAGRRLDL